MKWLPDPSGRFPQRPFYEREELDRECEGIVATFLQARHGRVAYPITTNELTILIEQETIDLDLYAELSSEGDGVEGVTEFFRRGKPRVRITEALSAPGRENRLRTTLTHELGHVKFHTFLWTFETPVPRGAASVPPPRCHRETIIDAREVDWLEWQAGYASGAFLMPLTALRRVVRDARRVIGATGSAPLQVENPDGQELIRRTQQAFEVSADAARVRLLQLHFLSE